MVFVPYGFVLVQVQVQEHEALAGRIWNDGGSEPSRHDQSATAARREEVIPKVEVLQSRLTRAAAALRRRAFRVLFLAR